MRRSLLMLIFSSALLCGCVVGQNLELDYAAETTSVNQDNSVLVKVADARPYVVNGDKAPWFIGKYRGGFGNPWDVTTDGKKPLAEVVADDVEKAVRSNGFGLSTSSPDRTLSIEIRDWNFDGFQNGRFWCELEVEVVDDKGSVVASDNVKQQHYIDGTFWGGAKAGFEKQMPTIYEGIIQAIVDNEILKVLRG